MYWWLCAHRAINVPLSQALTAQLASATFKAGSYLLQTSKASSVSCPQDAAQHQVAPGTGSLPSQAFATQACTIPRAGSGQCCAGTGPEHPALSPGCLSGQLGGLCLPAALPLALTSWLEWHRGPHSQ